jgi:hypothetical protein
MHPHSRRRKPLHTGHIEVHVMSIDQLFNSIDPSPFHARDLDPAAQDYIVDSSKVLPKDVQLQLVIHLDHPPINEALLPQVTQAIQTHFASEAAAMRLQLKDLFSRGRISLLIGLFFLSVSIGLGGVINNWRSAGNMAQIMRESLLIGGWVAMWRPMEIFLYDWWPITARIRLFDRLATIPVRILSKRTTVSAPETSPVSVSPPAS